MPEAPPQLLSIITPQTHTHLKLLPLQNRPRLLPPPPTHPLPPRELKPLHTLRPHLDTIPRLHGRNIIPFLNPTRPKKVLVQMIHILQHTLLATHNDIINRAEVLRVLGETHAAAVGHDGDVEFCGHEEHGDDLVYAAQPACIDLADVDCAGLEELLEHDAVLAHFAGCDADVVGFQG